MSLQSPATEGRLFPDVPTKISETIERQSAAGQEQPPAEFADYVRELQRIALGHDPTARARDRLAALKELVKLDADPSRQTIVNINPWAAEPDEPDDEPEQPDEPEPDAGVPGPNASRPDGGVFIPPQA